VTGSDWIEWGSGSSGWLYKYQMKGLKARIYGVEFDLSYKTDFIIISTDYSKVIGDNISDGIPLPYIPPSKSRVRFTFNEIMNFNSTLQIVSASKQNRLGEFEKATDGYTRIDFYGSYNLKTKNGSHKIIFQIDNIFDEVHYNHLSKIKAIMPEMGRSVSIQYRFLF
jgi:iron complex outermembrane receptor protein